MPDSLSIIESDFKMIYSFPSSQRRYCNPESFAGYLGMLAEISVNIFCSGMCFEDSTSYPSTSHPNGNSADTHYFSTLAAEQKKVDAFVKFHFKKILRGDTGWFGSLKNTEYYEGHEDHLHAGGFDNSVIKIVKEK